VAKWANALAEPQCSGPGWLTRWRGFEFDSRCRHVESGFLHAMRLNSWAGTEGSPVSSYKCDRQSHPEWGRMGVARAAGVDNRRQGPVVLQEGHTLAPWLEGKRTGPSLGLSAGGG